MTLVYPAWNVAYIICLQYKLIVVSICLMNIVVIFEDVDRADGDHDDNTERAMDQVMIMMMTQLE